jgi:phosphoglycolate phosphatase-like HAD superfamily hydrolase
MAAKNANIDGVAVLTGYADVSILKQHTDNIFNNLFEAVEWLEKKY